jgi:DNA repair protein RecO (recombination protein O)
VATYSGDVITLSSRRFRDTEAICHFFSRERGKIEASARGIGRPGSKLTPATELFTLSRALFAEGRNLDRLIQCEVKDAFQALRTDMRRMACAAFAVELIDKTSEAGEASPEIFELLADALRTLCVSDDPELTTWGFETRYLALVGLGAEVRACVSCRTTDTGDLIAFSPGVGGVLCRECAGHDEHRVVRRETLHAFSALRDLGPRGAAGLNVGPRVRRELDWLIGEHRRFHVEPEIRSAKFMAEVAARRPRKEETGEDHG